MLLIRGCDLPGEWFITALWGFNNEHIVTLAGGNSLDGKLALGICITKMSYSVNAGRPVRCDYFLLR